MSSKRASGIGDIIFIFIIMFVLALVIITIQPVRREMETEFLNDTSINETAKDFLEDTNKMQENFWDNMGVIILVFLTLVLMVSSYFIDSHPVFFVVFVLLAIFFLVVAAIMSNAYIELSVDSDLASSVAVYPKINWIMSKWPFVILIQAVLVGMVLYTKFRLLD